MSIIDQQEPVQAASGLPIWKLLAFTLAGFLAIMTETMPAGLLPQISESLGVSKALAGQLEPPPIILVSSCWIISL